MFRGNGLDIMCLDRICRQDLFLYNIVGLIRVAVVFIQNDCFEKYMSWNFLRVMEVSMSSSRLVGCVSTYPGNSPDFMVTN